MRVVVVGQGYVGLPLAMRAAEVGHQVVGVRRRRATGSSGSPPASPTSRTSPPSGCGGRWTQRHATGRRANGPRLRRLRRRGRHRADPAAGRRPRPALHRGSRRARWPASCGRARPSSWSRPPTPAPPRSWSRRSWRTAPGLRAGADFHLGYSPERIDPGNRDLDARNTPKVVSGDRRGVAGRGARPSTTRSSSTTVPVSSPKEAELTKLLENTFRHVNIALVNELAMFAHDLGIDVWEAIDAASTKPFGFMRFTPGPGVGGHCLPIDPSYLSWRVQRDARPELPLRRAGQRHQRPHARLRGPPAHRSRSTQRRKCGQRLAGSCCSAWRTRRTPATPGSRRRCASPQLLARPRRRGPRGRPARGRGARPSTAGRPGRADRARSWPPPTRWCCSPTTTPSTTTWSPRTPRYVLDCRNRLSGTDRRGALRPMRRDRLRGRRRGRTS